MSSSLLTKHTQQTHLIEFNIDSSFDFLNDILSPQNGEVNEV